MNSEQEYDLNDLLKMVRDCQDPEAWEQIHLRMKILKDSRNEAERLLRLSCEVACGEYVEDNSLEALRKNQSPELADMSLAIGSACERLRKERDEAKHKLTLVMNPDATKIEVLERHVEEITTERDEVLDLSTGLRGERDKLLEQMKGRLHSEGVLVKTIKDQEEWIKALQRERADALEVNEEMRKRFKTLGEILGDPIGADCASLEQAATEVMNERDDLETRADPAGEVAQLTLTKDDNQMLRLKIEDQQYRIAALEDEGSKLNAEVGHMQEQKIKLREARDAARDTLKLIGLEVETKPGEPILPAVKNMKKEREGFVRLLDVATKTVDEFQEKNEKMREERDELWKHKDALRDECDCLEKRAIESVDIQQKRITDLEDRLEEARELYQYEHETNNLATDLADAVGSYKPKGAGLPLEQCHGVPGECEDDNCDQRYICHAFAVFRARKPGPVMGMTYPADLDTLKAMFKLVRKASGCPEGEALDEHVASLRSRLELAEALAIAVENWNDDPTQHWINEIVEAQRAYRENKQPHVVNNPPLNIGELTSIPFELPVRNDRSLKISVPPRDQGLALHVQLCLEDYYEILAKRFRPLVGPPGQVNEISDVKFDGKPIEEYGLQQAIDNRDARLVQSYRRTIAAIRSFAGDEAMASGCDHLRAAWEMAKGSEQPEPRCPIHKFMTEPFPFAKGGIVKGPDSVVVGEKAPCEVIPLTGKIESVPGTAEKIPTDSDINHAIASSVCKTLDKAMMERMANCQHIYPQWSIVDGEPTRVCLRCGNRQVQKPEESCFHHPASLETDGKEIFVEPVPRRFSTCPICEGCGISPSDRTNLNAPPCRTCEGSGQVSITPPPDVVKIPIEFPSGTWPVCCNKEMGWGPGEIYKCLKCEREIEKKAEHKKPPSTTEILETIPGVDVISESECYPHKRCPDCKGTGDSSTIVNGTVMKCSRCNGTGILDDHVAKILEGHTTESTPLGVTCPECRRGFIRWSELPAGDTQVRCAYCNHVMDVRKELSPEAEGEVDARVKDGEDEDCDEPLLDQFEAPGQKELNEYFDEAEDDAVEDQN